MSQIRIPQVVTCADVAGKARVCTSLFKLNSQVGTFSMESFVWNPVAVLTINGGQPSVEVACENFIVTSRFSPPFKVNHVTISRVGV